VARENIDARILMSLFATKKRDDHDKFHFFCAIESQIFRDHGVGRRFTLLEERKVLGGAVEKQTNPASRFIQLRISVHLRVEKNRLFSPRDGGIAAVKVKRTASLLPGCPSCRPRLPERRNGVVSSLLFSAIARSISLSRLGPLSSTSHRSRCPRALFHHPCKIQVEIPLQVYECARAHECLSFAEDPVSGSQYPDVAMSAKLEDVELENGDFSFH